MDSGRQGAASVKVEQLDLFALEADDKPNRQPPPPPPQQILNGMYYEASSQMFVSFVLGERYNEFPAKGCGLDREWQERTKRERAI